MNANKRHKNNLSRTELFALWLTNKVGTMQCAGLFLGIGVAALVGALTNWEAGILCGLASSQVIQLVLLPVIMVGQNIQSKHAEHLADVTYEDTEEIKSMLHALLSR